MTAHRPSRTPRLAAILALPALLLLPLSAGCPKPKMVLELQGSIMYEKPTLREVSHTLTDRRAAGGRVVVEVTVLGDPGLAASFDVSPAIAARQPMVEAEAGRYVGSFSFPADIYGGPYTIIGRLQHERAGEVIRRDPEPVTITLYGP